MSKSVDPETKVTPIESVKDNTLIVFVSRDSDGTVKSEVTKKGASEWHGNHSVTIDRAKGRQFDIRTVVTRAKSLSRLLKAPYCEDLTWRCQAHKKLLCKCPECIKEGRC